MPLLSIPGAEAVRARKDSRFANWGVRNEENRVEPFTRPAFDVPFTFEPGEKIFTIGSCFARNVENELRRRGFAVPMVDVLAQPVFEGIDPWFLNNYGTPSIRNEIAWAFGEETLDEAAALVETSPGKFYDLTLHHGLRPGPIEQVRARRAALTAAMRELADCRVLVMTLGLVEVWWDGQAGRYLNTTPLPSILARWPDRFALHVLSFEEAYRHLVEAFDIVGRHCRPDLQTILTVSPVPLQATHRTADVIVANCYSKSVLRAVAEHVVLGRERISYFPSYESVTLSDRRLAWQDDFVHVTKEIVAFNVDRMVNAYTGAPESAQFAIMADLDADREPEGALGMIEEARKARAARDADFFAANADWAERSTGFLIEHAGFLAETDRSDAARALLARSQAPRARLLLAELAIAAGDDEDAIPTLRALGAAKLPGQKQWRLLLDATARGGDAEAVIAVEREWLAAAPYAVPTIAFHVARVLRKLGDIERAVPRFREARDHFGAGSGQFAVESAAAFLDAGLHDEARDALAGAEGATAWQRRRLDELRAMVERAEAA
ncbi:MAG: GSCFA domain-containing protein [Sphingomonadaceae bacterium]|nr:GSCFA domain-containing protein [Sphingomonadaceae bacterium]